jgi:membrane associated rhomboid family serine protease
MLAIRITVGVIILGILAILDWKKNGPNATRWREYRFLLITVIVAMVYGVINDQITSRISWEYFYYGKGLAETLPTSPTPHPRLSWEAAKIGMQATWSAGLLIGVAILIANNPRGGLPQLPQRDLLKLLPMIFAITIVIATLLGLAGFLGWLTPFSQDFQEMERLNEWRPPRFIAVFGIHLGGYIGGLLGTAIVCWMIFRRRHRCGR